MILDIKKWGDVPNDQIKELFLENPYPLYRGSPLANDLMKEYMFILAKESASINDTLVVLVDGVPMITGQFYLIPYLSKYWNTPIGGLGHIAARKMAVDISAEVMDIFSLYLSDLASNAKFVSVTIPGPNISLIRSFEQRSFAYAEGFINMVSSTNYFRDQFRLPGLVIRNLVESDFDEIDSAYKKTPFPARFVSDGGFDPERARKLYVH